MKRFCDFYSILFDVHYQGLIFMYVIVYKYIFGNLLICHSFAIKPQIHLFLDSNCIIWTAEFIRHIVLWYISIANRYI